MPRTLPTLFTCRELRAFKCYLVVTKVMYCGDLLVVGDKPNQHGKIKRKKQGDLPLGAPVDRLN